MDSDRLARYLRVGGAVLIAICVVWWIIDFSGYMKRDGFGAAFGCLFSSSAKCASAQAIPAARGDGGTGAYEPVFLWIAIVVFAAGYILPRLMLANAPAAAGRRGSAFGGRADLPGAMPASSFSSGFRENMVFDCPQARVARVGDRYLVSDLEGDGYSAFESNEEVVAELDRRGAPQETIAAFKAKA